MAEIETTRFGDLCRLCATKTNIVLSVNIFSNDGILRELDKKIETCLPIQIHESDELPKMICEHCLYKLELYCEFRERTLRTEALLINLYKELNNERVQQNHIEKLHSVVEMDRSDMLLVQHHVLPDQNIQEIDHLDLRSVITGHEIILEHENVINSHTIGGIINHHELVRQELSSHSLQCDSMLDGDNVHDMQNARFSGDNLDLMHSQHMLEEDYRLQHNMDVGMGTESEKVNLDFHTEFMNVKETATKSTEIDSQNIILQTPANICSEDRSNPMSSNENTSETYLKVAEPENIKMEDIQISESSSELPSKSDGNEKDWLYCNMCGKTFVLKEYFDMHYEDHFSKCNTCLAVFTNKEALNQHRKEIHDKTSPIKKTTKTRAKPEKSSSANNSMKPDETIETESEMEEHSKEAEEDEDDPSVEQSGDGKKKKWSPKVCTECGKTYKTNYKLTEHMRKHTGEKPYKCGSCEKAFRSKIGLAQHEAKHTGHYDYACPTCGKGFQCKSYLMVHQRVHSDVKPYPCTTCGRNFKTKQSLLDHTNRHLGVKPYMCDVCGRGFITKGLCKAHQKIHTGMDNRKYSCKICNKKFVSKSYLQTHLRIHTGEKPFICEVCGKGFLTRVDLRIHSTMHTGEKSYVCEMCGKAFARRDALRCHRRSHTGERPYSCDLCGQTFTQFSPMAIHKRLHTGERPYTCETCGRAFVSRSTMMSHAKKHHR